MFETVYLSITDVQIIQKYVFPTDMIPTYVKDSNTETISSSIKWERRVSKIYASLEVSNRALPHFQINL